MAWQRTDSAAILFPADESKTKPKMWNGFRLKRNFLIIFLINVIIFQLFVYYREKYKWQETRDRLEAAMRVQRETQASLMENVERLEGRDLPVDDKGAERPTIYAITPTFARPAQKAELTRLSQTFLLVPNFHWIVVEDAQEVTPLVTNLLALSGLRYTHLAVATPPNYKLGKNDPNWKKPRGVEQRNAALRWIREHLREDTHRGVVFFADDDNTYSVKLFREMEKIQKVGVWPVGLVGGLMVEKPLCDKATNRVTGFNAVWKPDRPFPIDMAGFAINLRLVLQRKDAWFSFEVLGGFQESEILKQMVTRDELEPLADFCTKVYVWHTRTEPPKLDAEQLLIRKGKPSNAGMEV